MPSQVEAAQRRAGELEVFYCGGAARGGSSAGPGKKNEDELDLESAALAGAGGGGAALEGPGCGA